MENLEVSPQIFTSMLNIIKVSQQRACWKADELTTIGGMHDKLVEIINKLQKSAENEADIGKIQTELNTITEN